MKNKPKVYEKYFISAPKTLYNTRFLGSAGIAEEITGEEMQCGPS